MHLTSIPLTLLTIITLLSKPTYEFNLQLGHAEPPTPITDVIASIYHQTKCYPTSTRISTIISKNKNENKDIATITTATVTATTLAWCKNEEYREMVEAKRRQQEEEVRYRQEYWEWIRDPERAARESRERYMKGIDAPESGEGQAEYN